MKTNSTNESPSPYTPREFYGPLEKQHHFTKRRDTEYFKHPEDPDRLIRYWVGGFADKGQMDEAVAGMNELLTNLTDYGVTHVNPEYFDATPERGPGEPKIEQTLGMTVDLVRNPIGFEELIAQATHISDAELYEIDKAVASMCDYIADTEERGGVLVYDVLLPSQFVYVPDNEEGKRFVLADMEPIGLDHLEANSPNPQLVAFLLDLVKEIVLIRKLRPDGLLASTESMNRVIASIPDTMPRPDELRQFMREVLDGGPTQRLNKYIAEELGSGYADDEWDSWDDQQG